MNRRQDRFQNPYQNFSTNYAGKHKAVSASYEMFTPPRRNFKPLLLILLLFALLIGGSLLYSAIVGRMVSVSEVSALIPGLPKEFEGYTILHISDLYGARFGKGKRTSPRPSRARTTTSCASPATCWPTTRTRSPFTSC